MTQDHFQVQFPLKMTIFSKFGDYLRPFDSSTHLGVTLNRNWISRPYFPLMIREILAQLRPFPSLSGPKNGEKQGFESFLGPFFWSGQPLKPLKVRAMKRTQAGKLLTEFHFNT